MANSLGEDVKMKYVVLKRKFYKGDQTWQRVFICKGGFGCSHETMGRAIIGTFVFVGEKIRIDSYEIERFAEESEILEALGEFRKRNPQLDLFPAGV